MGQAGSRQRGGEGGGSDEEKACAWKLGNAQGW